MAFATEPNHLLGCFVTSALAIVLVAVALICGAIAIPSVWQTETDRALDMLLNCLKTLEGEEQFGRLSKLPVGNSAAVHRISRLDDIYATANGQLIIADRKNGPTKLIVKAGKPLTQAQTAFLRRCSLPPGMW